MSKNLKHALYHAWLWQKENFLGVVALCFLGSAIYHLFPHKHILIDLAAAGAPFVCCFLGFTKDHFSWKYSQSLPLTKRELYHFHILRQYIVLAPFVLWFFFFPDVVSEFVSDKPVIHWGMYVAVLGLYLFGTFFIGVISFQQMFTLLRQPYVKKDGKYYFLQNFRNVLYVGAAFIVGGILFGMLSEIVPGIGLFIKYGIAVFGIVAVPGFFIFMYWFTFRLWNREELSYFKINFKTTRDVPLMAICSLAILLLYDQATKSSPEMYGHKGNTDIFKAIHNNDAESFYRLVGEEKIRNSITDKGWTPLMVAAHEGNEAFFNLLWDKGARRDGKINTPDDKAHHNLDLFLVSVDGKNPAIVRKLLTKENANSGTGNFTALHLAASTCSVEIIDALLENGADPNALNASQSSPLHTAARKGCFAGVVSLIDGGANPLLKNKEGKIALDYLKGTGDHQIAYYLEKKGRQPASK